MPQALRVLVSMAAAALLCAGGRAAAQTAVPDAPRNLVAVLANDVLSVSWDPPVNGAPILSYVLRVGGPGLPGVVPIPTISPSFSSPFPSDVVGTYTFTVSAMNQIGEGPTGPTFTLNMGPPGVPDAPRNLTASVVNNVLSVAWDPPLAGPAVVSYVLRVGGPGLPGVVPIPTPGPSFSSPLPANLVGTFSLVASAVNQVGEGPPSAVVTLAIGPGGVPDAPRNLVATIVNRVLLVTWDQPATGAAIDAYILRAGGPGLPGVVPIPTPHRSFSVPLPSSFVGTYTFAVSAVNQVGEGPSSAVVSVTTGPASVPDPPRNLTAVVAGNMLIVTWEAPANEPDPTYVLRATGSTFAGVWTFQTGASVFAVPAGQLAHGNYAFTVSAVNFLGEGNPTAPATVTIGPPCPVPGAPTLSASKAGNVVSLAWTTPGGGAVRSYTLRLSTATGGVNQQAADVGLVNTIAGPAPPGTYFFQIVAQSTCGPGAPSNQVRVDIP
jgi:hypothetical protein